MLGIVRVLCSLFVFVGLFSKEPALFAEINSEVSPLGGQRRAVGAWEISYVYNEFFNEEDFLRISEFFTGEENKGFDCVVRSSPEDREGMYFIIELNDTVEKLPKDSRLILGYILSDNPKKQSVESALPVEEGRTREIYAGLTGDQWLNRDASVVAWQIRLEAPSGDLLLEQSSFLWELPSAEN